MGFLFFMTDLNFKEDFNGIQLFSKDCLGGVWSSINRLSASHYKVSSSLARVWLPASRPVAAHMQNPYMLLVELLFEMPAYHSCMLDCKSKLDLDTLSIDYARPPLKATFLFRLSCNCK